jgi:hypothetical protein
MEKAAINLVKDSTVPSAAGSFRASRNSWDFGSTSSGFQVAVPYFANGKIERSFQSC